MGKTEGNSFRCRGERDLFSCWFEEFWQISLPFTSVLGGSAGAAFKSHHWDLGVLAVNPQHMGTTDASPAVPRTGCKENKSSLLSECREDSLGKGCIFCKWNSTSPNSPNHRFYPVPPHITKGWFHQSLSPTWLRVPALWFFVLADSGDNFDGQLRAGTELLCDECWWRWIYTKCPAQLCVSKDGKRSLGTEPSPLSFGDVIMKCS